MKNRNFEKRKPRKNREKPSTKWQLPTDKLTDRERESESERQRVERVDLAIIEINFICTIRNTNTTT